MVVKEFFLLLNRKITLIQHAPVFSNLASNIEKAYSLSSKKRQIRAQKLFSFPKLGFLVTLFDCRFPFRHNRYRDDISIWVNDRLFSLENERYSNSYNHPYICRSLNFYHDCTQITWYIESLEQ